MYISVNGFVLGLGLKRRITASWKWAIWEEISLDGLITCLIGSISIECAKCNGYLPYPRGESG